MATKKTREPELKLEEQETEEIREEAPEEPEQDAKDAEIAKLKAQLAAANSRAAYSSPRQERARIAQLADDAANSGLDPWSITVETRVPRRPRTEDPWYWININGRSAQIPADDRVQELKLPWATALLDMLAAEELAQDFADSLEVKDPVNNPH